MTLRWENILQTVAQRLHEGGDPLAPAFLADLELSAEDVGRMTAYLSTIVRGYAMSPEFLKRQIRAAALCTDHAQAALMVAYLDAAYVEGKLNESHRFTQILPSVN